MLDKTLMNALEQLELGRDVTTDLLRRLVDEGLCTKGPHPVPTAFGTDVLSLRRALADPPTLVEPKSVQPLEHCIDVTASELELLRLAAALPLEHPHAQHLPRPIRPRHQDGAVLLDLDEGQLAAVAYVLRLYGATTSTRFHNRLLRRNLYRELADQARQDG